MPRTETLLRSLIVTDAFDLWRRRLCSGQALGGGGALAEDFEGFTEQRSAVIATEVNRLVGMDSQATDA